MGDLSHLDSMAFYGGNLNDGYDYFGAHPTQRDGREGWLFRVWAPNAQGVSVVGDFCDWNRDAYPMYRNDQDMWEVFIPALAAYDNYKFAVRDANGGVTLKADPYAFHAETRPETASKLYDLSGYDWQDGEWMRTRRDRQVYDHPLNIYEVHPGSWRRHEDGSVYDYRTLADELSAYCVDLGYNCVELMPITEYPFDASWGYQVTGYFAATSRYGTPKDFMYFVDRMHAAGISVILDWVPSHFCKDTHGLRDFDGTSCYEYEDPRKREHLSWGTRVFDYGRGEVKSFLLSSAAFWIRKFHVDGLRMDAVASMLYLNYDRRDGEWSPNQYGGQENIEAIEFLRALNRMAFSIDPGLMMVAEESTAWPGVTKPLEEGGLGFNLKWNMGWMNDMCHYLKLDPWFRQFNHKDITFSFMYAFSENFVLPISHDEVVHMKGSLRGKMPGDDWGQLAGVRGFTAYLYAHPGKQLTFMGAELGQWHEWDFANQIDWYLLREEPANKKTQDFFRAINRFYLDSPELWELDFGWEGFDWLVPDDNENNIVVFLRRDRKGNELIVAVNFSPNHYENYRFGVPAKKEYTEVFNTDRPEFGGSGWNFNGTVACERIPSHGREASIAVTIPPYGAVYLRGAGELPAPKEDAAEEGAAKAKKPGAKPVKARRSTRTASEKRKPGRPKRSAVTSETKTDKKT
ncbi:MAG: 1,4-alpha-glucan branching protein GlgB [Oscillospiraceae bacterium]|nr:1,4-alpha-glucan branching protein GlgB [Oscillospiraceae bacterium]